MNIGKVIRKFESKLLLSEVQSTCESRRWKVYDWCEGTNAHGFLLLLRKGKERAGIKRTQDGGLALVEVQL
jgi:hypothetical protein